jgi:hypothetical protein
MIKSALFTLSIALLALGSGCATYDALTGKDSEVRADRVDAITQAAQSDLNTIAPVVSAVHPLAGVGVEALAGVIGLAGVLFGAKQKRNASNSIEALKTVAAAINKAESIDPALVGKIKDMVMRKSTVNGTAKAIDKAVQSLPGG